MKSGKCWKELEAAPTVVKTKAVHCDKLCLFIYIMFMCCLTPMHNGYLLETTVNETTKQLI